MALRHGSLILMLMQMLTGRRADGLSGGPLGSQRLGRWDSPTAALSRGPDVPDCPVAPVLSQALVPGPPGPVWPSRVVDAGPPLESWLWRSSN